MKKQLLITIVLIVIVVGAFLVLFLDKTQKRAEQSNKDYDPVKIENIDKTINLTKVRYNVINNIIYYDRDYKLSDEDYLILERCSTTIQSAMPSKKFLYLRTMKSQNRTKTYRFAQMDNMMQIDGAELNIDCSQSGAIDNIIGVTNKSHGGMITAWANPTDTSFTLTLVEAKDILVKYFYDNENDYNIVKNGSNKVNCRGRLYYYDSKVCQKIEFDVGKSYIIIDANTGEILEKYFHNGIDIEMLL